MKENNNNNNNLTIKQFNNSRVALVHDFLVQYGGAERVLEVLCEMFPEAPIYTLLHDPEKMRGKFSDRTVIASFLQKFPRFLRKRYKYLLPLMPVAPETFDLRDFDVVISSSGAWSKGIVTRLNTLHISYLHSPMRFVWDANEEYLREVQSSKLKVKSFITRIILNYIRTWDRVAADRPDYIIANSCYTRERIKKYYGRDSTVICPPVTANRGAHIVNHAKNDARYAIHDTRYFLIVSRLSPYKNIDKVIEAFNKLELPLIVIGEGSQERDLKKISGPSVKVLGWQPEEKIARYHQNARAFVFAGVDDFGIAPVEAMSFGVPVLAIREGGAKEIVIEGKTGEFFDAATPEVIADGIRRLMENEKKYDKNFIIKRAEEFGKERFVREFGEYMRNIVKSSKIKFKS